MRYDMKMTRHICTEETFLSLVEASTFGTCWGWGGRYNNKDRPMFGSTTAYRWAYTHWVGPVPEGLEIDHTCLVGWCVNWQHLEAVTKEENLRRQYGEYCPAGHFRAENRTASGGCRPCKNARALERYYELRQPGVGRHPPTRAIKTACPAGHLYDLANTGYTKQGWRYCRTCSRERARAKDKR
jgi:hypothetical protein